MRPMSTTLGCDIFIAEPIPQNVTELVPNGDRRMFSPLSITLIHGENDAVLVDPPLTIDQAKAVGDWVERSRRGELPRRLRSGKARRWRTALPMSASGSPESARNPRTRGARLPRAGIQSADDLYARGDRDVITTGSTEHGRQ